MPIRLAKYSIGVGDRFAKAAVAQLQAFVQLAAAGVEAAPVWNKSNREHILIGSEPSSVLKTLPKKRFKRLGWQRPWHVDADHVRLDTVDRFWTLRIFLRSMWPIRLVLPPPCRKSNRL